MFPFKRVVLIILDGLGVGELPDAEQFGDSGSHTLQHVLESTQVNLPTLASLGLGNIVSHASLPCIRSCKGFFGKMAEKSAGKDTTSGHWELMGVIRTSKPKTYPNGFPQELLAEISRLSGYEFLGNFPASGTEIIKKLGEEHMRTRKLIVYTSADSVLQIAAHKDVVPLEELYRVSKIARQVCQGNWEVDRVIARPFIGDTAENFTRTAERKDFSLSPPRNYLDELVERGIYVTLIGKLEDVFAGRGFSTSIHTSSNYETMNAIEEVLKYQDECLVFANLIDFDSLYGHRNDPLGYARALEEFDVWLGSLLPELEQNDLLIVTSDHGNDPTTPSTDHSREYVPLLAYSPRSTDTSLSHDLGLRETFADVGATIAENFAISSCLPGSSFLLALTRGIG